MSPKPLAVVVVVILAAFIPSLALGSEKADEEFRTLLCFRQPGWAAWLVVPDWTLAEPKLLAVAGPSWQYADGKSKRWIEAMGGGLRQGNGTVNPVVNVRLFDSRPSRDVYADGLMNFDTRKLNVSAYVVYPLWQKVRAGIEMDAAVGAGKPQLGIGPRLALPFACGPAKCAVAATYFARLDGRDVGRLYLATTF